VLAALAPINARILQVDDASPDGLGDWAAFPRQVLSGISALRLGTNLGHRPSASAFAIFTRRCPPNGCL